MELLPIGWHLGTRSHDYVGTGRAPGPPLIRRAFPLNALRCEEASLDAWHRNCQCTV